MTVYTRVVIGLDRLVGLHRELPWATSDYQTEVIFKQEALLCREAARHFVSVSS